MRQPDGAGDSQLILHPLDQPCQHHGGGAAMQFLCSRQVHKGLVQRQGFHFGGELIHHRTHRAADFDIGRHARFDHHRIRAELQRLKHRHGGAHAANTRHIAGGRDNAAFAATNDYGLAGELWIVALFDAGVKGVAIHMGNRQREQFTVLLDARAAAFRATSRWGNLAEAITAKGLHGAVGSISLCRAMQQFTAAASTCL